MLRITTSFSALAVALATPLALATPALAQDEMPAVAPLEDLVDEVSIPYTEFELDNGLTVIVHEDRKAPIVAVAVWYNVGSKDEPEGLTGFAHLFEHLMFNGSENAPNDYFQYLQEMGATDYNGTTSFDRTNYFQTVPRPALDRALWLESDRMGYFLGAVTQQTLNNQIGVVQNEKRQGDNNPGGLVFYEILETLFPKPHPYGHSVIGSMADIEAATLDTVGQWFRDKYGPNNATLVLAGDISAEEARPMVEKWFGAIPRGPANIPAAADVPTLAEPVRTVMKDRVAATSVSLYWPAPGILSEDLTALNVGTQVLGGLLSSRLDQILVREEQLAVSVNAGNFDFQRVGIINVGATLKDGVELATLEARLNELIAEFIEEGPTEDEVRRAATSNLGGTIRGLEQVGGFGGKAVALAQGEVFTDDPGFAVKQLELLASIDPADVRAAMQKWMTKPALTLILEPGEREGEYAEGSGTSTGGAAAAASADDQITVSKVRPAPPIESVPKLDFPEFQRTKLANGMELTFVQRQVVPATWITMSFDAGSAADPVDLRGLEGLTLNLFDEGTTTMTSQQIAEARERLGVSISTGGGDDRSTFTLSALTANLAPSLDLFSQVIREPAFNEGDINRLKAQTATGIRQQMRSPQGVAQRTLGIELYGADSPYGGVTTLESIGAITRDDIVNFKDTWIRPDNGEVFVISSLPMQEIVAQLNAAFGDWEAPATPKGEKDFSTTPSEMTNGGRIVLINRPNSPQSFILGSQITSLDASDPAFVDFTNANNALSGGFLSRLNMNLRETKGWSYGVGGGAQARENTVAYFMGGGVQADRTGDSVAEMIRETAEFLTTNGMTQEELTRIVTAEIGELPGQFETSGAVLGAMQSLALYDRPDDYYETLVDRFTGQTQESLDAAARAAIDADDFVWVVVGDAEVVQPQLEALGLPVEVRQMEGG